MIDKFASTALLAAALAMAPLWAGSAFAQDKTRADVKAETASAGKAGASPKEASPGAAPMSNKPRAEVKKERDAAAKSSAADRTTGDAGVTPLPKSSKSRAEVKKERDAAKPKNDAAKAKDYTPSK